MKDIRQSSNYANYLKSYGWIIEKAGNWNVFVKKFPLIGSLIKIQRIVPPIPFVEIELLAQKHRAFKVIVEFNVIARSEMTKQSQSQFSLSLSTLDTSTPLSASPLLPPATQASLLALRAGASRPHLSNYRVCSSPFLPTKTIVLDLKNSLSEIFDSLPKEKRRLLKRLEEKKEIIIKEGTAQDFVKIKSRGLLEKHILPFGVKKEINSLKSAFSSDIRFFFACPSDPSSSSDSSRSLAGALFLFDNKKAYYWEASSTNLGKKLGAPSLLLWGGIKIAKQKRCEIFDLEGIYDERFPIKDWRGFTHFKKQFGGTETEFPLPLSSSNFPLNLL